MDKFLSFQAVLSVTSDEIVVEDFKALWPWIGGDCLKSKGFYEILVNFVRI